MLDLISKETKKYLPLTLLITEVKKREVTNSEFLHSKFLYIDEFKGYILLFRYLEKIVL